MARLVASIAREKRGKEAGRGACGLGETRAAGLTSEGRPALFGWLGKVESQLDLQELGIHCARGADWP